VNVAGARYVDFLLPGMLALGLVSSCLWGIGWNLVEMRPEEAAALDAGLAPEARHLLRLALFGPPDHCGG